MSEKHIYRSADIADELARRGLTRTNGEKIRSRDINSRRRDRTLPGYLVRHWQPYQYFYLPETADWFEFILRIKYANDPDATYANIGIIFRSAVFTWGREQALAKLKSYYGGNFGDFVNSLLDAGVRLPESIRDVLS